MVIYLMRHGETDLNRGLRMQGSVDEPLNEKGRSGSGVCSSIM